MTCALPAGHGSIRAVCVSRLSRTFQPCQHLVWTKFLSENAMVSSMGSALGSLPFSPQTAPKCDLVEANKIYNI